MGKTKGTAAIKEAAQSSSKLHKTKKQPQPDARSAEEIQKAKEVANALRNVELPKSAEGLTAEKLSPDQKMVFKKHCQNLYGHKFSGRRKLPAHSIESATSQLEAKMKEKAKQLKEKKKKKKKNEWNPINAFFIWNFR